jgi:glycosyltransferase involved in cell wall biosynthesis
MEGMKAFLFVAIGLVPQEAVTGGDKIFREVASRLLTQGHGVTIMTSLDGKLFCQATGLNAEFVLVEQVSHKHRPGFVRTIFIELKRMAKAIIYFLRSEVPKGTVVFATSDLIWEVLPVAAARGKAIIKVFSFHMVAPHPFRGYRAAFGHGVRVPRVRESLYYAQQLLAIAAMRLARGQVLAQPTAVQYLIRRGIEKRKIVGAILSGADTAQAARTGRNRILYDACWIGRYHPQKGCDDLIDVWEMVCRTMPGARLLVMGRVEDELRPMVERKKIERNVQFLGLVEQDDVKFARMNESKLLLYPSYYEGFPVTVCEALACGLPVIAYDLPIYREYFRHGVVTVAMGNREALANEVTALLGDEPRRGSLADQARRTGAEFDWDRVVNAFLTAAKTGSLTAYTRVI